MSTSHKHTFAGFVLPFAGPTNKIPVGAMLCDGRTLNTTEYAKLFAVIGYVYGGSGSSFRVPDCRGVFIRGVDNGRGIDSGRALGSYQEDSSRRPRYSGLYASGYTSYAGNHRHTYAHDAGGDWDTQAYGASSNTGLNTATAGRHRHNIQYFNNGDAETRPKNYATNYIIVF